MDKSLRQDKGVAGLTLILSIITMLFVIGLLLMIYTLMGASIMDTVTDPSSINVINATIQSMADVPDWFPLVIIMGFMVVLILLTVIIITAIRGSGLMGDQGGA